MEPIHALATGLGLAAIRALDIDVHWSGVDHLPTDGPALLASTHVAYVDFPFIQRAAMTRGRRLRFMCRHDVWNNRAVGWAMDRMRHIPVDRQVPAHAYLRARSLLRDGEAVCGFPEAGISYSFTVRPLMRGIAALARETGVPVVPVAVWGPQRLYTVGNPEPPPDLTRGRRVDIAFGEPIEPGQDLTAWTHALGHRLTNLLEGLQRMPEHRPRPGEVAPWYPAHLGGSAPTREEALALDVVPNAAVRPSWGPHPEVYDAR